MKLNLRIYAAALFLLVSIGTSGCIHNGASVYAQSMAPEQASSAFFTTSDGVRLHYFEAGEGRPVVLVPGWTMPAAIWAPQIRALSPSNRVVALDPRSQGRSETADGGHYHERRARDIHELLEHLDLSDVTLVGWSLGASEVLIYANNFGSDRLAGLVLVDGWVWPTNQALGMDMLAQLQRDRHQFFERFVRGMYRTSQPASYLQDLTTEALRTPEDVAVALGFDMFFGPASDHRSMLESINRPLLFVATPFNQAHADTVIARNPSARVEIFEESGHALFVDEATRFTELLDHFMKNY